MEKQPSTENHNQSHWFSVTMKTAHLGTGSHYSHTNYVYATNAYQALKLCRRMRGVKSRKYVEVVQLEPDAEKILLGLMQELKISIDSAIKLGLYGMRHGFDIEIVLRERLEACKLKKHYL